jgi:DNA polymerase III subunit epsilon
MLREVVIDVETSGPNSRKHNIVEVACVELMDKLPTGKTFHAYCHPIGCIEYHAFRTHGLSEEFLKDKPFFPEIADDLLAFIGNAPLVAHGLSVDFHFLNSELQRAGRPVIIKQRWTDTVQAAKRLFPNQPIKLSDLCSRFGIDDSQRAVHGAMLDAELLAEVYACLVSYNPTDPAALRVRLAELKAEKNSQLPPPSLDFREFGIELHDACRICGGMQVTLGSSDVANYRAGLVCTNCRTGRGSITHHDRRFIRGLVGEDV